jgi:hypothetical protein
MTKEIDMSILASGSVSANVIRDVVTYPEKYYPKTEIFGYISGFIAASTKLFEVRVYKTTAGVRIIPNYTQADDAQIRLHIRWICV